ncbi:protoheme IX farnesyltransferase, mitochondrial-like [Octopus vulgaris]|uniref:Protoheme IX farnesyltransferase, mitochondrial n=1 Tax=Octopus vulgaris TaxID=6645 RepID=A0AA36F621_OCTVU|nr:protoheme IX farnesyltransferase, mitochondrial-like [Octopus vulgaris]
MNISKALLCRLGNTQLPRKSSLLSVLATYHRPLDVIHNSCSHPYGTQSAAKISDNDDDLLVPVPLKEPLFFQAPHITQTKNLHAKLAAGDNLTTYCKDDNTDFQYDNTVSIFVPHLNRLIDVKLAPNSKYLHLFLPATKEVVRIELPPETDNEEFQMPTEKIESIQDRMWMEQKIYLWKIPNQYMQLAKIRLTGLVVISSMAGYALAPAPFHLSTFLLCTLGTGLMSASANSINQFFEVPFDAQMNRTRNRVLVRGYLSPLHAVLFATATGLTGMVILSSGVNSLTAYLGLMNLGLYTLVYTPMKRTSIANTWVGSLVGAIPPMMGWAACTGDLSTGAWLLGAVMYAWQFPHFNALSWNLRADYSRGGYCMTSVMNPSLCRRVAFRYCAATTVLSILAPFAELTTWMFVIDSLPLNFYLTYLGWRFYKEGDSKSSRNLFRFTLLHLPVLFTLMLLSKKPSRPKADELTLSSIISDVTDVCNSDALYL